MGEMNDFLSRAADRCGFVRDTYIERRMPTDRDGLAVFMYFGDMRCMSLLSSLLLKRYREEDKGSKYFILVSWPGYQSFFPYVDEYWSFSDYSHVKRLFEGTRDFKNVSDLNTIYLQGLNEFFRDVTDWRDLEECYFNGIQQKFWDKYKHVKRFLPMVPSSAVLGNEFNSKFMGLGGYKVFVAPFRHGSCWRNGKTSHFDIGKDFWVELIKKLTSENFTPIILKNYLTHDISSDLTEYNCVFLSEKNASNIMAVMRATGCVLDVFGNLNNFATLARTPFVTVTERALYSNTKQWEFDDLVGTNLQKQYIFTFSTIITEGYSYIWGIDIFNNIVKRLRKFYPELIRENFLSTAESNEIVKYDNVRKKKNKRIGARLLKVKKD